MDRVPRSRNAGGDGRAHRARKRECTSYRGRTITRDLRSLAQARVRARRTQPLRGRRLGGAPSASCDFYRAVLEQLGYVTCSQCSPVSLAHAHCACFMLDARLHKNDCVNCCQLCHVDDHLPDSTMLDYVNPTRERLLSTEVCGSGMFHQEIAIKRVRLSSSETARQSRPRTPKPEPRRSPANDRARMHAT